MYHKELRGSIIKPFAEAARRCKCQKPGRTQNSCKARICRISRSVLAQILKLFEGTEKFGAHEIRVIGGACWLSTALLRCEFALVGDQRRGEGSVAGVVLTRGRVSVRNKDGAPLEQGCLPFGLVKFQLKQLAQ